MNIKPPIFRHRKMESNFSYPHKSLAYQLLTKQVKPQILDLKSIKFGQFWPNFGKNLRFLPLSIL